MSFWTAVCRNKLKVAFTRPHCVSVTRYRSFVECTSVSAGYTLSSSVQKHLVRFSANGVSGVEVECCVEAKNAPSRRSFNLDKVVNVVGVLLVGFLVQFRLKTRVACRENFFIFFARSKSARAHNKVYLHVCMHAHSYRRSPTLRRRNVANNPGIAHVSTLIGR